MQHIIEALRSLRKTFGSMVTGTRLALLLYLYFFGPQPVSAVVKNLGYTWSEIDRLIKKLEEEKLIVARKLPTKSGVRTIIALTDRGIELVENIIENLRKVVNATEAQRTQRNAQAIE